MTDTKKESVLITGANGFVGSRLCRRFLAEGYHVIAGVRDGCDGSLLDRLDLEFRFGDITMPETLKGMVAGVDYIIQNAGLVKASRLDLFYEVNCKGTRNIVEAAEQNADLKKFVYISSMAHTQDINKQGGRAIGAGKTFDRRRSAAPDYELWPVQAGRGRGGSGGRRESKLSHNSSARNLWTGR